MTPESYLLELYQQSEGNIETTVSMYGVGTAIGLEKAAAGSMAEDLMVQGFIELRTLAGGISITIDGLKKLGKPAPAPVDDNDQEVLSKEVITDDADNRIAHNLANELKELITSADMAFDTVEEIVMDIKTIELHLMSARPKNAVIRELFRSIMNLLLAHKVEQYAEKIAVTIGE